MIEVTFLGTAASYPTKERNAFSVHLKHLNNRILFDCGEGTQRQMMMAGLSPYKVDNIFITHIHADHLLGLGGLIQTMNFWGREKDLYIYGPAKLRKYVNFFKKWDFFKLNFHIKTREAKKETIFENNDYKVSAFPLKHSCPCYGYVWEEKTEVNLDKKKLKKIGLEQGPVLRELKEKGKIKHNGKTIKLEDVSKPLRAGKKISVVVDTVPIDSIVPNIKNSDLFLCESTHAEELKERSHLYGHMTAKDAARLAKKADVGRLVLSHISARYEDEKVLEKEAKEIFKNTIAAHDLMVLEI